MLHNNLLKPVLTTWKNPPLRLKNLSDAQARLCVDQVSQLFVHVPLSIKYIISRHLIYAGEIIQLHKYDHGFRFSMDQIIWARAPAKNFRCLEAELELWNLSYGFTALLQAIVAYDINMHLQRETYFSYFSTGYDLHNFVQV